MNHNTTTTPLYSDTHQLSFADVLAPVATTPASQTLAQARATTWTAAHVNGVVCPCCDQFVKVYARPLNSIMARILIVLYHRDNSGPRGAYHHLQAVAASVGHHGGEGAKLVYWGLAVEERMRREDGGRAGQWAITDAGRAFVERHTTVPRYAVVYNGQLQRMEGPEVSIVDALGARFDYDDLMRGGPLLHVERRAS